MAMVLPLDPNLGKPKKLLDQVRDVTRLKHYSLRTARTYCDWIERFIRFHEVRHPRELGEEEISTVFDASSARWRGRCFNPKPGAECAAISLQGGAKEEIGWLGNLERAKKPVRLPVWLGRSVFIRFDRTLP